MLYTTSDAKETPAAPTTEEREEEEQTQLTSPAAKK